MTTLSLNPPMQEYLELKLLRINLQSSAQDLSHRSLCLPLAKLSYQISQARPVTSSRPSWPPPILASPNVLPNFPLSPHVLKSVTSARPPLLTHVTCLPALTAEDRVCRDANGLAAKLSLVSRTSRNSKGGHVRSGLGHRNAVQTWRWYEVAYARGEGNIWSLGFLVFNSQLCHQASISTQKLIFILNFTWLSSSIQNGPSRFQFSPSLAPWYHFLCSCKGPYPSFQMLYLTKAPIDYPQQLWRLSTFHR